MRTLASHAYQSSVMQCALDMAGEGGFTVKMFAQKCGFKVTNNLRRSLKKIVDAGLLQATPAYTDSGHLAIFYHNPVEVKQLELFSELPF